MLRAVISDNPPIDVEAIDDFADRHRLNLPRAYREFLLRHNGGCPVPAAFPISSFEGNSRGVVQDLFGLKATTPTSDLDWVLTESAGILPAGILPIGCTGGYDFVCLDLRKPSNRVVYWDRRPSWGNNVWDENDLYPVARDFEAFLDALHPHDWDREDRE